MDLVAMSGNVFLIERCVVIMILLYRKGSSCEIDLFTNALSHLNVPLLTAV